MKAIRIDRYGGPEVLQYVDVAHTTPGAEEALVRIKAAGVNFIDIYERRGDEPPGLPYIPGLEAAGIVERVGTSVTTVKPGDRVAYTGQPGAYAEYSNVKADSLIPLPENISFEQGAAFPSQGLTAHFLLHEYVPFKKDAVVLIHAAAGGMGLLLTQWAKHLGAKVIGTVSTEEKGEIARASGADHLIIYSKQDFVKETMHITDNHGADLILDGVGKTTFPGDLQAAAVRGHIVIYGEASGIADPISLYELQPRSLTVSNCSLRHFIQSRSELMRRVNDVMTGLQTGWLKLRVDHILPLSEASEAHRLMEQRLSSGKIVLTT
jgi:NADPH2:quinone reductase